MYARNMWIYTYTYIWNKAITFVIHIFCNLIFLFSPTKFVYLFYLEFLPSFAKAISKLGCEVAISSVLYLLGKSAHFNIWNSIFHFQCFSDWNLFGLLYVYVVFYFLLCIKILEFFSAIIFFFLNTLYIFKLSKINLKYLYNVYFNTV